jgi:hypothetical protein
VKKFVAVYTGSAAAREKWDALDPQKRKEREKAGMEAWEKWVKDNQKSIVEQGTPLGKTKRVGPQGISDTSNNIAAYTVVQADSHEAAAKLFENHPHFTLFPGEAVEVMPCLDLPVR